MYILLIEDRTDMYKTRKHEFALFNDSSSQEGHSVSYMTILFSVLANHRLKHQAANKLGCQPDDCRWPL